MNKSSNGLDDKTIRIKANRKKSLYIFFIVDYLVLFIMKMGLLREEEMPKSYTCSYSCIITCHNVYSLYLYVFFICWVSLRVLQYKQQCLKLQLAFLVVVERQ